MQPLSGFCALPDPFAGFLLESEGFNPLKLDPDGFALVFWTAVTFLALLFLLTRYAWGPLMQTVKGREERIAKDLAEAEEARREAEEARERHRLQMEQAAQEARALLEEARNRADKLRSDLELAAREEARGILERAKQTIEAEKQQALREIKDQVVDLSVAITARLVGKSVDREDHLREVDDLLAKLKGSS